MKIIPINNNNQINSKAVNQKYYQWAEREAKIATNFIRKLWELE